MMRRPSPACVARTDTCGPAQEMALDEPSQLHHLVLPAGGFLRLMGEESVPASDTWRVYMEVQYVVRGHGHSTSPLLGTMPSQSALSITAVPVPCVHVCERTGALQGSAENENAAESSPSKHESVSASSGGLSQMEAVSRQVLQARFSAERSVSSQAESLRWRCVEISHSEGRMHAVVDGEFTGSNHRALHARAWLSWSCVSRLFHHAFAISSCAGAVQFVKPERGISQGLAIMCGVSPLRIRLVHVQNGSGARAEVKPAGAVIASVRRQALHSLLALPKMLTVLPHRAKLLTLMLEPKCTASRMEREVAFFCSLSARGAKSSQRSCSAACWCHPGWCSGFVLWIFSVFWIGIQCSWLVGYQNSLMVIY